MPGNFFLFNGQFIGGCNNVILVKGFWVPLILLGRTLNLFIWVGLSDGIVNSFYFTLEKFTYDAR